MDKILLTSFSILYLIVPNLINANVQIDGENNSREYIPFLQDSINDYHSVDKSFNCNDLSRLS